MHPLFAFFAAFFLGAPSDSLQLRINPAPAYIERDARRQVLNLDLLVQNNYRDTLTLVLLKLRVRDASGRLVLERFLDGNGLHPSIRTMPDREVAPGTEALFFNPFTQFDAATPLNTLEFEMRFERSKGDDVSVRAMVSPKENATTPLLQLPVKERLLVYDGHDYYSHHRRFHSEDQRIRALGLKGNFMRFSYDFLVVDSLGSALPEGASADSMTSWPGFGVPVLAAAAGEVIATSDSAKDDRSFNVPDLQRSPVALYGNYVAVRHADGSIALYGHLKQRSVRVRKGDRISTGQPIASIGASGSSLMPHLHFELRTSIGHEAEGLPALFGNFRRFIGARQEYVVSGLVDTGELLQAAQ
ncbi:MAG: M23 family metallopeptidase [Chitinophagaceae bacterium]|nr:MAG: M23 family metallopeptidase [Chitinophagaceae bacterium]